MRFDKLIERDSCPGTARSCVSIDQVGGKDRWEEIMKRILYLIGVVGLFLLCTGCQTSQDTLYQEAMSQLEGQSMVEPSVDPNDPGYLGLGTPKPEDRATPIPGDDLNGELTVRIYWPGGFEARIQTLANEFMKLHPQTTIQVEQQMGTFDLSDLSLQERRMKEEQFYTQLRTELAAGEADYLLFDTGEGLNLTSFSRSGVLEDLKPYLESDPDFSQDTYYFSVLEAFQVDGKQTLLPQSFAYNAMYFDQALLDQIGVELEPFQTVSTLQVLDWYEAAREINPELRLFYVSPWKDDLFTVERTAYMNLENRTSNFQDQGFVDFLSRTEEILVEEPEWSDDWLGHASFGMADDALTYQAGETLDAEAQFGIKNDPTGATEGLITQSMPFFAVWDTSIPTRGLMVVQQPMDRLAGPYVLTNSQGEVGLISRDCFAMPTSVTNKELAWEFIKYCISEREDTRFTEAGYAWDYTLDIPVTRANWEQIVQRVSDGIGFATGYSGVPNNFNGINVGQVLENTEFLVSQPLVPIDYYNVDVQDYLDEFYKNGLTTAQECAEKIQGRADIWLNE